MQQSVVQIVCEVIKMEFIWILIYSWVFDLPELLLSDSCARLFVIYAPAMNPATMYEPR